MLILVRPQGAWRTLSTNSSLTCLTLEFSRPRIQQYEPQDCALWCGSLPSKPGFIWNYSKLQELLPTWCSSTRTTIRLATSRPTSRVFAAAWLEVKWVLIYSEFGKNVINVGSQYSPVKGKASTAPVYGNHIAILGIKKSTRHVLGMYKMHNTVVLNLWRIISPWPMPLVRCLETRGWWSLSVCPLWIQSLLPIITNQMFTSLIISSH